MDVDVVAEVEIDAEEIELVAGFASSPTAKAECGKRGAAKEPDGDVEIVDVLFDDVITGEFGEIEPIFCHIVGIGLVGCAAFDPRHATIPLDHAAADFTDGSGVDESFVAQVAGGVTALGAADHGQAFSFGFLAGGDYRAGTYGVHCYGFFDKGVLAGLDGGVEVQRAEPWRGGH